MRFRMFMRTYVLAVAMVVGVVSYLVYRELPLPCEFREGVRTMVGVAIPLMIFVMLYVTFCKVDFARVRITRWHLWLILFQCALMFGLSAAAGAMEADSVARVLMDAAFVCVASPTATGSVLVLTQRFGGDGETTAAYTIISNLLTAFIVPLCIPIIKWGGGLSSDYSMVETFLLILRRVTPLLALPIGMAYLTRRWRVDIAESMGRYKSLPLYLWAASMCLAIAMTMRFILNSDFPVGVEVCVAVVAMAVCAVLFFSGKNIGGAYGARIGAGQGLGQRNTVFIIWLGSTFLSPTCSIAGGFYSVWQNLFNTWQMRKRARMETR